jgi:BirA family biotin operon repressor/biotin-[acetyl-CoA-carboxylase] ligase
MNMESLPVSNPLGAPVFHLKETASTMDEARALADSAQHGTVLAADYQSAGRGRAGRPWKMNKGESLPFTVILKYGSFESIPVCFTLRAGLAVSAAIEEFAAEYLSTENGPLKNRVKIKWPNDIILIQKDGKGKKAAGILSEASGGTVLLGIGINVAQTEFPAELAGKACSIAEWISNDSESILAAAASLAEKRFTLLEKILGKLFRELDSSEAFPPSMDGSMTDWRQRLDEKLYMKGQSVSFVPGPAPKAPDGSGNSGPGTESPCLVNGVLEGIGENGEIRIAPPDGGNVLSFITGELKVY